MEQATGNNLPTTVEMGSSVQSTVAFLGFDLAAPPARLDDRQLAAVETLANAPLPALPSCGPDHFTKCMRALATLPRQHSDEIKGEMQFTLYRKMLGSFPEQALSFLCETALLECDWFPTIKQCRDIIGRWNRSDQPVLDQARAEYLARAERQTRFDEAMARLVGGDADQAEIDAMPDRWKQIAETRSLLWRHEDGSYSLRLAPQASLGTPPTSLDEITGAMAERFPSSQGRRDAA
jgi:hypothetical protein